jgi:hypothetical protein
MTDFIASGRIVDVILALMLAEAVFLAAYTTRTGGGVAFADIAINLVAGASLLLAVRAALVGAAPQWLIACLLVSLAAHGADLRRRWRSAATRA